ncbi:hypothetical protein Sjap_025616 [Stephania japonica]|uniref:Uncharacterized protein n=1 Tax=Stephania japonica TaxID=461633 RepID=A0AAP0E4M1_9MAGN
MSLLALTSILLFFSMAFTTINARTVLPVPVVDRDGDPVQVGVYYHLVSVIRGAGSGAVALGPNRNDTKTCPLSVVQLGIDAMRALPIRFIPVAPLGDGVDVLTFTDYILQFNTTGTDSSICGKDPIWKYFISTTNQITTDMKLRFKIERVGPIIHPWYDYKLSYSPILCSPSAIVYCKKDIGVYWDDEVRRLALTDDSPLVLGFYKASSVEQINVL